MLYFFSFLVCASTLTYPHEVIWNIIRTERNYDKKQMSFVKVIENLYKNQGIAGFFGGFKINLIKILPNTAITFAIYEKLSYYLEDLYYKHKIKDNKI